MANTIINEVRNSLIINNVETYQINNTCTAKGNLQDTGIYLHQIVDDVDPTEDIFTRVVAVADFEAYTNNRATAVANGDTYWRSSQLTKSYTSPDVAKAAAEELAARANSLITAYATYISDFVTAPGGVNITYPNSSVSAVATLQAAYDAKYTLYEDAVAADAAAQVGKNNAAATLSAAQTSLNDWTAYEDSMSTIVSYSTLIKNNFADFVHLNSDSAKYFINDVDTFIGEFDAVYYDTTVRVLTFAAALYINAVPGDVGKAVGGTTTLDSGILVAYDNTARIWWVRPDDANDLFDVAETIVLTLGTGTGTTTGASTLDVYPLNTARGTLETRRDAFNAQYLAALAALGVASAGEAAVAAASALLANSVSDASDAVYTAQAAYNTASKAQTETTAAMESAYSDLGDAYYALKDACPAAQPANPFPPTV